MARRAGSADLPLHSGHVPQWLAERMATLGAVICQAIVHHYGRDEFLRRLAHPFWFQSFGAVMGMDWHSSGITTSVIGALKRGLDAARSTNSAFTSAAGGASIRGETPAEFSAIGDRIGLDGGRARQAQAVSSPRSIAQPFRMASNFTCTASSSPMTATGPSFSRA